MRKYIKTKYGYDLMRDDGAAMTEKEASLYHSAPQLLAALRLAVSIIEIGNPECARNMKKVIRQAEGGERTSNFLINE